VKRICDNAFFPDPFPPMEQWKTAVAWERFAKVKESSEGKRENFNFGGAGGGVERTKRTKKKT